MNSNRVGTSVRQANAHSLEESKSFPNPALLLQTQQSDGVSVLVPPQPQPFQPVVLRHKYQQLKDPKKYAQMLYLTYEPGIVSPKLRPAHQMAASTTVKTVYNETTDNNTIAADQMLFMGP